MAKRCVIWLKHQMMIRIGAKGANGGGSRGTTLQSELGAIRRTGSMLVQWLSRARAV